MARSAARDLVNRAVRERDHVQVAAGAGLDVGADAEAGAESQRLAFADVEFRRVVGDAIGEPGVCGRDLLAIRGQVEAQQVAVVERRA